MTSFPRSLPGVFFFIGSIFTLPAFPGTGKFMRITYPPFLFFCCNNFTPIFFSDGKKRKVPRRYGTQHLKIFGRVPPMFQSSSGFVSHSTVGFLFFFTCASPVWMTTPPSCVRHVSQEGMLSVWYRAGIIHGRGAYKKKGRVSRPFPCSRISVWFYVARVVGHGPGLCWLSGHGPRQDAPAWW